MNLAGLRYWQWILIGLLVGAGVGWAWMGAPTTMPRSGDPDNFAANVRRIAAGQTAQLRNVIVFTPETDPNGRLVYPVTYERFVPDNNGSGVFQAESLNAKTPFSIGTARPWLNQYPASYTSILDYLQKNHVPFSNRTGNAQYTPVIYGAAGGMVLIGLVWPTAIRLLVNAGLASPAPVREKKVKKEKAKTKITVENDGSIKSGPRGITSADVGSLNALNDDLEKKLASGLSSGEARPAAAVATEPVSIFMSGGASHGSTDPTEAAVVAATEDEKKDYKGEWYPVARPIVKKDGEH